MTPSSLADEIDERLRALADPERALQERRYLRSAATHLGVSVPRIRAVAEELRRRHPGLVHGEVVALVEDLWARGVHEDRMAAVEVLALHRALLDAADAVLLERLLRESGTWALVDGLAISVAGDLLGRHPEVAADLDRWAVDEDRGLRRAALLASLPGLRTGRGDFARFAARADRMLDERDPFIRKAIGWVLRETGRTRPDLVAAWLRPRVRRASGVTVREAVKRLPPAVRDGLLAARASGADAP